MSTDNPNFRIDENAVAKVDARIRETKALTKGIMSSWANPMGGIQEGPKGKVTIPKVRSLPDEPIGLCDGKVYTSQPICIKVPAQAMKTFKQLLPLFGDVDVSLTPEQKKLFLEALEQTPTPKLMSDAKAIFGLMESLSK